MTAPRFLRLLLIFAAIFVPAAHATTTVSALQSSNGQPPNLILETVEAQTEAVRALQATDSTVVRARAVRIDLAALPSSPGGQAVGLNLFDDVYQVAVISPSEPVGSGSRIWVGRIESDPASSVTIANHDGAISANIRVNGASYQIRSLPDGSSAVIQVNPTAFPDEAPPRPAPDIQSTSSPNESARAMVDDGSIIDELVVYTAAARTAAGGTPGMQSQVALMIAETNAAYANSGINQRLRLAAAQEVAYTETGDPTRDIDPLTTKSDGILDEVHTLRNSVAADTVTLIVESGSSVACGVGWLMGSATQASFESFAFNVVVRSCATGNYSFGHELGHNMGANHDRGVTAGASQSAFNFGFVAPSRQWRTIMAYADTCGCQRLQFFSNPDVTFSGEAMGIRTGQANAADNHRTLNESAFTVANFRASVSSPPPPTLTPTPVPSTPTRTATPPTGATPTRSPTPTSPAVLGGRNLGISPGLSSATLLWDPGSSQSGYLVARYLPSFSLLAPGVLPASATSTTDSGLVTGQLYCYVEGPTTGSPPTLAGVSNFVCVIANTQSPFAAPQNFTLRVTQSGNASLSWSAPPAANQDGYRLISLTGANLTLGGAATSQSIPLSGFDCFELIALNQGTSIGNTAVVCGLAGASNLGADQADSALLP